MNAMPDEISKGEAHQGYKELGKISIQAKAYQVLNRIL